MADNWVGFKNKNTSSCVREDHDFDEQDVWGECDYTSNINRVSKDKDSSSSSAWKNIPKGNAHALVSDESFVKGSSSAPMNIPDWSKVYGKKNCKNGGLHGYDNEDDEDDEEGDMVPPHEWIARKLARSQISSFSVCEGMGRTLKGRDLSKVRNAILSKTGFIE
ncbi:protein S40-7-like [Vicia villosa]|uniref:protein S40-7-like n=1 Tax=Vicia villosa TaxID=3911 RepID=UPI00273B568B|nr:protein S40-7-like [Vicia villosa]